MTLRQAIAAAAEGTTDADVAADRRWVAVVAAIDAGERDRAQLKQVFTASGEA